MEVSSQYEACDSTLRGPQISYAECFLRGKKENKSLQHVVFQKESFLGPLWVGAGSHCRGLLPPRDGRGAAYTLNNWQVVNTWERASIQKSGASTCHFRLLPVTNGYKGMECIKENGKEVKGRELFQYKKSLVQMKASIDHTSTV